MAVRSSARRGANLAAAVALAAALNLAAARLAPGGAPNCSALLPPGTSVRSSGCCRPEGGAGAAVPCSAAKTPFGDCAFSHLKVDTPQYHVMDKTCDENDPNAPFFDAVHGFYHLFYQKHCAEPVPGEAIKGIVYGHVASRDLVKWARLPVAVWNDQPYDNYAIYSGSATVVNGTPHIIYPGLCLKDMWPADRRAHYCTNFVDAVPADHASDRLLKQWAKPTYNPIVNGSSKDPSAAWETAAGGEWRLSDNERTIYSTTDWRTWRSVGVLEALAVGDCPSLLPLPRLTPGSGPAPATAAADAKTPTHVHITSGNPFKTWMQVGRYTDGAAGTPGSWEPLQPCLDEASHNKQPGPRGYGCGQCTDAGQTYAAKNFFDPVKNRTLLWTWAGVAPNATMALVREMTWNAELQQLQFAPIAEQVELRGDGALAARTSLEMAAGSEVWLASAANQTETEVVFELPAAPARFGVVTMGAGTNTSSTAGGFFWLEYSPQTHSATVGYHSGGTEGGAAAPDRLALAKVMPGVNLRGLDLKVVSGYKGNWTGCQALCASTAVCKAWTWCRACPDTTKCCLKSGIPAPTEAAAGTTMVSGVMSVPFVDQCKMSANHSACTPTATLRLSPTEKTISLRVFTDRTFAEAYWQDGRVVMTASTPPSATASIALAAVTTAVTVKKATVWSVGAIWTTPNELLQTPRPDVHSTLKSDDNPASSAWRGPALSVRRGGRDNLPQLLVDGKNGGAPLWLVLHLNYQNMSTLDEQVRRARDAGLRTVCVCLTSDVWNPAHHADPWLSDARPMNNLTRGVFDRIVALHPRVLFIIRFYAFQPDIGENMVLLNMTDGNATDMSNVSNTLIDGAAMNSLTIEWETKAVDKMTTMLKYLDNEYPGRIAGVFPCYLHTSEWFMPGTGDIGFGGHSKLSDYSKATQQRYCSEEGGGGGGGTTCSLPPPSQRNTPDLGSAFADAATTKLNLWTAGTVAHAIETLATAAKKLSNGKLMTMSFYGYLMGLADSRLAGSGHLALHRLLRFPDLDAIASPYMYNHLVRNNSLGPLLPHGPWDAAPAHGKIWIVEDDSRTSLSSPTPLKFSDDAAQDRNLMRRNVLTALMRGNTLYFYDLATKGWFGRPGVSAAAETDSIWDGITTALKGLDYPEHQQHGRVVQEAQHDDDDDDDDDDAGMQYGNLHPEVAVFVDDVSAATRTVFDEGSEFLESLMKNSAITISSIGAPARLFVLSDLLLPNFDWSRYRMCVFLNAFVVTPTLSQAIETKLKRGNTTLVWTYAAGIYETPLGQRSINESRISDLIGIPLKQGLPAAANLMTHVPRSPTLQLGFPRDYGFPDGGSIKHIDPWFELDRAAAAVAASSGGGPDTIEVLGTRKADQTNAVLVRATRQSQTNSDSDSAWSSVFSASPGLPVQLWRVLAVTAGVHMYLPDSSPCSHDPGAWQVSDAVEVRGRFLMVHASAVCSGAAQRARTVQLPQAVAAVLDEANATVCSSCSCFTTIPMVAGEVLLYTLAM